MNVRSRTVLMGLMLMVALLGYIAPNECAAQKKYKDPYDKKVRRIADAAASYLKSSRPGGLPARTICALAVLEYHKRYFEEIPEGIPLIDDAIEDIARLTDEGAGQVLNNRETYFPAIALILLAEYDAPKYKKQCRTILEALVARQRENGAFTYLSKDTNDTSQGQFAALAFYVARQHRITLDPKAVGKLLEFYVDYQAADGSWNYEAKLGDSTSKGTNSIHSASLSSVYLLADLLRLQRRVKKMSLGSARVDAGLGLPKNVSVYIPAAAGDEALEAAWDSGEGPVVQFNRGKLSKCKSRADAWYQNNFTFPIPKWNSYFMYALERYAWFKEQADGDVGSALSEWYDIGVDYIAEYQNEKGVVIGHRRVPTMTVNINTALSLLFLVRASEVISLPPVGGELRGGEGFGAGTLTQSKTGRIISSEAEKSLNDLINTLSSESLDEQQLKQLTESMKRSIREFKSSGEKSRGEVTSFLKSMISDKNYYRRLIAIRFLSGQQTMDNVPALLYAMGDPNPKIAIQAHNGLRLISRKFDTFKFEDQGNRDDNLLELAKLKSSWTKWFLEIRPDAELLE